MLCVPGIDWSGHMIGKSTIYNKSIPVLDKSSEIYALLPSAIKKVEASLYPSTSKEILQLLAQLRLHYASSHMSEQQLTVLLNDYLDDLAVYPKDLIEQACIDYRKSSDCTFFPKISQLIKLIEGRWYQRKAKLHKLKRLQAVNDQTTKE